MTQSARRWASNLHGVDGRLLGSYVYFLCCASDVKETVYVKIGVSDSPTKRLFSLTNNCALRPLTFGVCNVQSRSFALQIEKRLHQEFRAWRQQGEWFRFEMRDKPYFSETRDVILRAYRSAAWPMNISVTGVMPVLKDARRKALFVCHLAKRKGDAFRDFQKTGGERA